MPKYWGKEIFAHGSFAEVGQKQKTEKKKKRKSENNGQAMHGARKHAWRTQAAWAKRRRGERKRLNDGDNNGQAMHGARMVHASRLGQKENQHR